MTDKPVRHIDEDGAIYAAEIVPPERDTYGAKYHVDLVRATVDDYGLGREQRLTVGQHNSWMEAEEQLYEVEDTLEQDGIAGWGENADRLRQQPFEEDVFYMTAVYPPDAPEGRDSAAQLLAVTESGIAGATLAVGERESVEQVVDRIDTLGAEEGSDRLLAAAQVEAEINGGLPPATPLFDRDDGAVRHIDGGGTAHWFAITERDTPDETEPYELRYFRALEMDDGTGHTDSYPVMPLPDDDPGSAWALPGLEMYLEKGDVYMAQQFAHDVADSYGEEFPEPMDLPALDPRAEYYFGYGIGPNDEPALEAVKTWMDGAERRFDTLTVGEYGSFDEAAVDERELETLLDEQGVEAAMNLAETMAVTGGYLDPDRDDPRIFFEDDAPPDPFTTERARVLAERELEPDEFGLTDPLYTFDLTHDEDDESLTLQAKKWWGASDTGYDHQDQLTVATYTAEEREAAQAQHEALEVARLREGLEPAMNRAETLAVANEHLDPEREDGRIFFAQNAPPDPFTTNRQRELALDVAAETQVDYDFTLVQADPETLELRAEKTWGDGDDVGVEIIALREYDTDVPDHHIDGVRETAAMDREELVRVRDDDGLETAMRQAEGMAVELGTLDPERDDPRLFTQGPPDPFTTTCERELAEPEYSIGAVSANGDSFLDVMKTWGEDDYERLVIPQPDWEMARQAAVRANDLLEQDQLEGAMQLVEDQGVAAGLIDPERDDPRLFTQGPPDLFTTMREEEIDDELARYGVTWRETQEWAQPTQPEPEAEVGNPYWRMETLPVNDPDGEPLGHSLHMVVYDGVEHNPEMVGTPAIPEDEPFRMLEMAHFETTEAADKFGKEFNGYLMPGLLEGPELAEEVARLEGHPVEWKTLEGQELDDYRDLKLMLTRDPADWQPYNPNAERDARIEAEGLYTDPIHQFTTFDEDEDDPKVEPTAPDFDL
ncbi:MAG: hypothetical protein OHK0046_37850 [Anaerolineae bacterium]